MRGVAWDLKRRYATALLAGSSIADRLLELNKRHNGWDFARELWDYAYALALPDANATFSRTSPVNVWGYNGDPSAVNSPQLIAVPANVQAITGGRWDGSKFLTTDTAGNTLHPFVKKSTPLGTVKVFKEFASHLASTAYVKGDELAVLTDTGNWLWIKCTTGGVTDPEAGPVETHATALTVVSGTHSSGTVEDTYLDNATRVVIDEAVGDRPDVNFDFQVQEGVTAATVSFDGYYDGNPAHYCGVYERKWAEADNFPTTGWTRIDDDAGDDGTNDRLNDAAADYQREWNISADGITANGDICVKFYHEPNPANGQFLRIDQLFATFTSLGVGYHDSDIGKTDHHDGDAVFAVMDYATLHKGGLVLEPAATNGVIDSREFDTAEWVATGTPTREANAVGVDGGANLAYTVGDDDVGAIEFFGDAIAVTSAPNPCVFTLFIKKDNDETRFPLIQVTTSGGIVVEGVAWLNTKTGAILVSGVCTCFVDSKGGWWKIGISLIKDAANNLATCKIYPAGGTVIGTGDVAATGAIVIDQADFRDNQAFMDSPIITSGGSATRAASAWSDTTAGRLTAESGAGRIVVTPSGISGIKVPFFINTDADNNFQIRQTATTVTLRKRIAGVNNDADEVYSLTAGTPYVIEFYYNTTDGMAIRAYDVGTDPSGVAWATSANKDNAVIGAAFLLGEAGVELTGNFLSCELSDNKEDFGW